MFHGVAEEPVPSLLRGFSAPVKLEFDYSDEQLMFLMANDSDGFNRWDAAQTLSRRVLLDMVAQRRGGRQMQVPDGLITAFRARAAKRGCRACADRRGVEPAGDQLSR